MLWLVQDFAFFAVAIRALLLTFQTLTVGGIVYSAVMRGIASRSDRAYLWIFRFALALGATAALGIANDSAILMATTGLPVAVLWTANYVLAGTATLVLAALVAWMARRAESGLAQHAYLLAAAFGILLATLFTSHAVSRLDHRLQLSVLTVLHQGAAAVWLGGMFFLLLALRSPTLASDAARHILRRFSVLVFGSVATLIATGTWLSILYVGSLPALYGTAYGVMVMSKAVMLLLLIAIGAVNFSIGRGQSSFTRSALILLRRIGELELTVAFAVLLMAASLTSQPPGIDLTEGRLTPQDIAQHFQLRPPVLRHPPLASLAPATPLEEQLRTPDDLVRAAAHTNRDPDLAWSEFEHNWAGLFLLLIGALGLLSTRYRWARLWPLVFIAMAIFLMVFSDPENWPLGPIGYWQSFSDPEVLLHRVALSLLIVFGVFESGVQTGRLGHRAALVFPWLAIAAASGFLVHSHSLGNVRLELLTEMSHTPISVLGILAGAFRCLEIWLRRDARGLETTALPTPGAEPEIVTLCVPSPPIELRRIELSQIDPRLARVARFAAIAWPLCLAAAGLILLDYREG